MTERAFSPIPSQVAILVSPAPLDGYPPVQSQARLLANQGYDVHVVTSALPWLDGTIEFQQPGVVIHRVDATWSGLLGAAARLASFTRTLARVRSRCGRGASIEIAYDPLGMLVSDLAPNRPGLRVAHFHECLQRLDSAWVETRLRRAIRSYSKVVVPDHDRADILKRQLGLVASPLVVPNYPMLLEAPPRSRESREFEVIYCGSLGLQQKLDLIIESIPGWRDDARFVVLGNDNGPIGEALKTLARAAGVEQRVSFEGWIPTDRMPARLAKASLGIHLLDPFYEQWRTALGASNKRYQYMQAGLPQIGDMNPGVPELLERQGVGLCIGAFSTDELARVVNAYVADPDRRATEGRKAADLHRTHYNYETAFAPLLDWMLAGASSRGVAA